MDIRREHIDHIFDQKFSLSDQKQFVKYLNDRHQSEQAKAIVEEHWSHFDNDLQDCPNLDHVFYKLYYTINSNGDLDTKGKNVFVLISKVAAILLVGILIGGSILFFSSPKESRNDLTVEFISQTGFRNQFKLPDGTTGWLGYGSQLKYHIDKNDKRVVDLDGLAYFDVAHHKKQSFIVNTPAKLNIEVLGTRFNVSSYSKDHSCEIVLEQGKVSLKIKEQKIGEMIPNERLLFNTANNTIEKSNVNVPDFVAWKDGKLILRDVSLEETCLKLGRYYNVDFELQTTLSDIQKVRLVLENEPLDDALKLLTMIVPIKFQVEERRILEDNSYSKKKIIIKNK